MLKTSASSRNLVQSPPARSLMEKVRQRGIIGGLAAFVGSGWLIYEIVHFILVDHYHLPDTLKDITIVSVLCAALSSVTWRWFRGENKARKPKWELVLIPAFVLAAAAVNVNLLLHPGAHDLEPAVQASDESRWKSAIAVLPFVNMSTDKEQEYFCDGLTEEMITKLSQVRELKVTARTSAFTFKGENRDIREIGQSLGVDKVLEGSVRRDGSRLRISAQLINVSDGFHIWSETYDRDLDNVFIIQDDIALSVAAALQVTLLERRGLWPQTQSLEAYNEYLLGRHFYRNPTKGNLEKALGHYEKAVELDPEYATAWTALGATLALQASIGYASVADNYPKAVAAVERALTLDDQLAYGYSVLGWIRMSFDWDWTGAEAALTKAMSLEAGRGLLEAAQLALALGRYDRALALARRAADLDALNASTQMNLALAAFYAGHLEESVKLFTRVIQLSPERANAHALLAQVYLLQSHPEMALAELEKEKHHFFRLSGQAMAYHALGREKESLDALAKFSNDFWEGGAFQMAQIHAFRGEADKAFEWLEIAYGQRDGGLFLTKADPFLKRLKTDPRYDAFLKRMRYPPDQPSPKYF